MRYEIELKPKTDLKDLRKKVEEIDVSKEHMDDKHNILSERRWIVEEFSCNHENNDTEKV